MTWSRRWKRYKAMLLLTGLAAVAISVLYAQLDSAGGGILAVVSAVLFDTYLAGNDGWPINLHAGGFEGFSVSGYFYRAYYFIGGVALVGLALAFLCLKPRKISLALCFIPQLVAIVFLSYHARGTFRWPMVLIAIGGWALLAHYGILLFRYWKQERMRA